MSFSVSTPSTVFSPFSMIAAVRPVDCKRLLAESRVSSGEQKAVGRLAEMLPTLVRFTLLGGRLLRHPQYHKKIALKCPCSDTRTSHCTGESATVMAA